jgi:hypothetical protein
MVLRLISVSDQMQLPEFHDAFASLGYEQVNNSSSGSAKKEVQGFESAPRESASRAVMITAPLVVPGVKLKKVQTTEARMEVTVALAASFGSITHWSGYPNGAAFTLPGPTPY